MTKVNILPCSFLASRGLLIKWSHFLNPRPLANTVNPQIKTNFQRASLPICIQLPRLSLSHPAFKSESRTCFIFGEKYTQVGQYTGQFCPQIDRPARVLTTVRARSQRSEYRAGHLPLFSFYKQFSNTES